MKIRSLLPLLWIVFAPMLFAQANTWNAVDVGTVVTAGSTSYDEASDTFTLQGAGADIWGTVDGFQYAHQTVSGDIQITGRLISLANTDTWAKAGLMIRQGTAADAPTAMIACTPANVVELLTRVSAGAPMRSQRVSEGVMPKWFRLIRSGQYVVTYLSEDGVVWNRALAERLPLGQAITVGLAVTSHNTALTTTALFQQVTVEVPPALTFGSSLAGWKSEDIGTVHAAGSTAFDVATGTHLLTSGGEDIWTNNDAFTFLHRPWYGDGSFVVHLGSLTNSWNWAKAGLMVRESGAAGSRHIALVNSLTQGIIMLARQNTGAHTDAFHPTATASLNAPCWLRLDRRNDRFSAHVSLDGVAWTEVATLQIALNNKLEVGLAVSSHTNSRLNTAMFDGLRVTGYDGNGNGLADGWEMAMFGHLSGTAQGDSDGDGLTNAQEFAYGTHPRLIDSDSDGIADGVEVQDAGGVTFNAELAAHPVLPGMLEWNLWRNIPGPNVTDLTGSTAFTERPSLNGYVSSATTPVDQADSFGQRLRGMITAPVTGDYRFWVAGDNGTELWLGADARRFSKRKIAGLKGYTGIEEWASLGSQQSELVHLVAGQKYWIELLNKEEVGGDHAQVAWSYPGQNRQVIPAAYLTAPAFEPEDLNDDSLPDNWASQNAVSGEYADPDNDGLTNQQEFLHGTNPREAGGAPGYLDRDLWYRLPGAAIAELTQTPAYLRDSGFHQLWPGMKVANADFPPDYGQRFRGTITAPVSGNYHFWIAGDNQCEIWLSSDDRKFKKRRVAFIDGESVLGWSEEDSFDQYPSQKSGAIQLQAGRSYYIEVLHKQFTGGSHISVAWKTPGGTRVPVPAQVLSSYAKDPNDLDDDDLPDHWEQQVGLNKNDNGRIDPRQASHGDYDADALTNRQEYLLGSNPVSADTDGDGYDDFEETLFESDPLMDDLEPFVLHQSIAGGSFSAASGQWVTVDEGSAVSIQRRGTVDYTFQVPTAGVWAFELTLRAVSATPGLNVTMPLDVYVDGVLLGNYTLRSFDGAVCTISDLTQTLLAGSHTLRIHNRNPSGDRSLRVDSVKILKPRGIDADNDGVADWIARNVRESNGVNQLAVESYVSPLCVEGSSRFARQAEVVISQEVISGYQAPHGAWHHYPVVRPDPVLGAAPLHEQINERWYSNVELAYNSPTSVETRFEAGTITTTQVVQWKTLNLDLFHGHQLDLRVGDSLKVTAYPATHQMTGQAIALKITSPDGVATNTTPKEKETTVCAFSQEGTYTLEATYKRGNTDYYSKLTVRSVRGEFGAAFSAYVGNPRNWRTSVASPELPLEWDSDLLSFELTPSASGGRVFRVAPNRIGTHYVVSRLGDAGPILGRGTVESFHSYHGGVTNDTVVLATYENGDQLVRSSIVSDGLPPGWYIELQIFAAGVTFEDGTLVKRLYGSDFDSNGVAYFNFNKAAGVLTSVCHRVAVYDAEGHFAAEL